MRPRGVGSTWFKENNVRTVNGAADRLGCSEDLFDNSGQFLSHGPGPHDAGGVQDVVHGDVTVVLDVLHLLPVTWGSFRALMTRAGAEGTTSTPV